VDHIGDVIGRLHAAGLDHRDLKHSNLLLTPGDEIVLLDLDSVVPPRRPGWRRRVRALGQLEVYAVDLYPWLPRTDRLRFLRAYLRRVPDLAPRRRALVVDVRSWVQRRLRKWARKQRPESPWYPLAPRESPQSARHGALPDGRVGDGRPPGGSIRLSASGPRTHTSPLQPGRA
jgi:serine/threonine protein kinase